ncbi:hypothetical protein A9P82_14965 [Arachidicoccus ginsenosidimutans]|uniref:GtrA family protein n=1 Tax=Arachidicoccus sp. BS20 TaxID=1850526 RepID=UPI0007F128F0|nr:GtrA family protein [Arachidicoccus sp. BS20]ANI90472.1 hypothetical protein A9P82_14965 [Arachidicoccus sp. BS20]
MITFLKAQASAIGSTAIDFITTMLLVELIGVPKIEARVIGLIVGGAANFFVNKKWVFEKHNKVAIRLVRYILVWGGNFLLNYYGYRAMLIAFPALPYWVSMAIVATTVGIFYNYLLQRRFVFK